MCVVIPRHKQSLGAAGEQLATEFLSSLGYVILDRNWRGNRCELDLVALDRNCLVFVEVKTRATSCYGSPLEAVTPTKIANMKRAALAWLAENHVPHDGIRFDAIGIVLTYPNPRIVHINAVSK